MERSSRIRLRSSKILLRFCLESPWADRSESSSALSWLRRVVSGVAAPLPLVASAILFLTSF